IKIRIIPIVAMFYLLSFLDRSNLGNARVAGLQNTLGITDHQYSVALTVTYIPYIAAEMPANLLLKKIGPNIFLPTIVTLWGLITTMEGFVKSYGGLIAARFFLGLVEGGMFPALVLYLSSFYTRHELQLRIALFFSAASLSGAFSGLLAFALIRLDGKAGLAGWSWIFIVEGLFTILWGLLSFYIFPGAVETHRFLTPDQKTILKDRILRDRSKVFVEDEEFSWGEVLRSIKSPHVILNVISLFLSGIAIHSLAYFQPTIIRGLGYSPSRTQLLSVPPFAVAFFVVLVLAYVSDHFSARGLTASFSGFIGMIGFLMFYVSKAEQTSIKYGSLFLSIAGVYSTIPPLTAWQSNNSEGHYRRATSIALAFIATNAGGIVSTWLFPKSQHPEYRPGTIVNLTSSLGITVISLINLFWLRNQNRYKLKNKDQILNKYLNDESVENEQRMIKSWKELGDKHPDFVYTY
ncbi:major facilitator superfamily domain-containing protein, partial [Phakopsora pachyrhizi]